MSAHLYNEWNDDVADWLQELIKDGLIPDGIIDRRSITDIEASELMDFDQVHFFAGIGGWCEALRLARVSPELNVWTGSPPCQPFSIAGRQEGQNDSRHLSTYFTALIAECRPLFVFGEQVASSLCIGPSKCPPLQEDGTPSQWSWIDAVFDELEEAHYACVASIVPAGVLGSPHQRQRLFFSASDYQRLDRWVGHGGISGLERHRGHGLPDDERRWLEALASRPTAPTGDAPFGNLADHGCWRREAPGLESRGRNAAEGSWEAGQSGDGSQPRRLDYDELGGLDAGHGVDGQPIRSDEHGQHAERPSSVVLVGNPDSQSSWWHRRLLHEAEDGGWDRIEPDGPADAGEGSPWELAGADGERLEALGVPAGSPGTGWDSEENPETLGGGAAAAGESGTGPLDGFWASASWVYCMDGKFRPVHDDIWPLVDPKCYPPESSDESMAHGIPEELVRLRDPNRSPLAIKTRLFGYGNAIVPPVAAVFVDDVLSIWADICQNGNVEDAA